MPTLERCLTVLQGSRPGVVLTHWAFAAASKCTNSRTATGRWMHPTRRRRRSDHRKSITSTLRQASPNLGSASWKTSRQKTQRHLAGAETRVHESSWLPIKNTLC